MKKFIAMLPVIAMCLVLSLSIFAADETLTQSGGSASKNVTATYRTSGAGDGIVYAMDITWGNMEFTYTATSSGTWNPGTHQYDGSTSGSWSCAEGANAVTVVNHSNTAVTATLAYTPGASYGGIGANFAESSGTANDGVLNLATAVGTAPSAAPSATAYVNLTGALAAGTQGGTGIGSIRVTIGS